jgi:Tol biopolymer transport system component
VHLADLRQLTFGGENAEAYFSPDGREIVFQSTRDGAACDQMFVMSLETGAVRRISSGAGQATCGFFLFPAGDRVVYSTTEGAGSTCPPRPSRDQGYVWPLHAFDVVSARRDGSDKQVLFGGAGYDAETTAAFDGSLLVFTSSRDGDLELYTARPDGTGLRRFTHEPGYDGGAFFSPDSSKIVWRASRPKGDALEAYKADLARGVVRPTKLEIYVASAAGGNARAVTQNGRENFAPSFLPDSRRVIFASNVEAGPASGGPPNFDLFVVDPDAPPTASGAPPLERITYTDAFDGFPMFSPNGKFLVFASNRLGAAPGDTNLFVARWVE